MHNLLQPVEWSNQKCLGPGLKVYGLSTPLKCSVGKQIANYIWNTVNGTWDLTQKYNRDFKQQRFWATNFNQKLAFFLFLYALMLQAFFNFNFNQKLAFFLFLYALMLPNLYCQVSLLLKRHFAQKFVQNHGSRVQKNHFRLTCSTGQGWIPFSQTFFGFRQSRFRLVKRNATQKMSLR